MRSRRSKLLLGAMLVAAAVTIFILIAGVVWFVSNIIELSHIGF